MATLELDDLVATPRLAVTAPLTANAAARVAGTLDLVGSARGTARQVGLAPSTILRAAAGEPVTRAAAEVIARYQRASVEDIWSPAAVEPPPPPAPPSRPGELAEHERAAIIADARAQLPCLRRQRLALAVVALTEPAALTDLAAIDGRIRGALRAIEHPS